MRFASSALTASLLSATSFGGTTAFTLFTPNVLKRTYVVSTSLEALYTPRTVQNTFLDVDFEKCESSELYSEAVKNTSPIKDTTRVDPEKTNSSSNQIPTIPYSVTKKKTRNISETFDNDFQRAVDAMHDKIRQETSEDGAPDSPSLSWSTDQPVTSFGNNGYDSGKKTHTKVPETLTNMFRKKEKEPVHSSSSEEELDVATSRPSAMNLEDDGQTNHASTNNWLTAESKHDNLYKTKEFDYENIYHEPYAPNEEPLIQIPYFVAEQYDEIEMSQTFTLDSEADRTRFQKRHTAISEDEKMKLRAVIENQKRLLEKEKEIMSTNHRLSASDLTSTQDEQESEEEISKEDKQIIGVQFESKKNKTDKKESISDLPLSTAISNQKQLLATNANHKRVTVKDLIPNHDQDLHQYQETQTVHREKKVEEFYNMDPITRLPQMVNLKHMNQYNSSQNPGGFYTSQEYGAQMPQGGNAGYSEQQLVSSGPFYQGYSGLNSQQGYGGDYQNGYNGPMSAGGNRGNVMVSPQGDIIDLKFVGGNPGMSYGTASSSRYNNSAGINLMGRGYGTGYSMNGSMSGMGAYGGPSGYGPAGQNGGEHYNYGMQGPTNGAMHNGAQSGTSWDSPQTNKMVLPQSVLGESGKCYGYAHNHPIFTKYILIYSHNFMSQHRNRQQFQIQL